MCLIQFAGIWFVNGKFSASWKLVQAVVQKPRATLQGQCFIKLKPVDKEKLKTQVVAEDEVDENVASSIVDDSSDDEEVDEEETGIVADEVSPPAPASAAIVPPVPPDEEPKKKRIIKKKE